MNKATYLLTLPIVEIEKGSNLGRATGVLLNSITKKVYLTMENGHPGQAKIIDTADIIGVGEQYLLIQDEKVLKGVFEDESIPKMLEDCYLLLGVEVIDASGTSLGKVEDLVFDKEYNILSLILDNQQEVKAESILSVCPGRIFVNLDKREIKGKEVEKKELKEDISLESQEGKVVKSEEESKKANNHSYLGLKVGKTVTSEDGTFQAKQGTVITEELMQEAERHDLLLNIAMYAAE